MIAWVKDEDYTDLTKPEPQIKFATWRPMLGSLQCCFNHDEEDMMLHQVQHLIT
jgi:hypothetical protein